MENDFSKVSLGFAEFVAQLMHETFDAILDAQNYQIEKYLGLEKALNTSVLEFKQKYLSDEEVTDFMIGELGFELKANSELKKEQVSILNQILSAPGSKEYIKTKLTSSQYRLVYDFLLDKLVNERKSKIRLFVERPELARLVVDSGEIKAKLNLFILNQNTAEPNHLAALTNTAKSIEEKLLTTERQSFEVKNLDFSKIPDLGRYSAVKAKEIIDKETGTKIILIDKESIPNKDIDFNLPTTRIVANPLNSTSSTNFSSEVTIKFRSI